MLSRMSLDHSPFCLKTQGLYPIGIQLLSHRGARNGCNPKATIASGAPREILPRQPAIWNRSRRPDASFRDWAGIVLRSLVRKGQYVIFSEHEDKPRADLNRPWRTISHRAKLPGVRIHDLRHTHASVGAGAGLCLPIIGKLLGHAQSSTTQRYAHLDSDPLQKASNEIAHSIARQMGDVAHTPIKLSSK
jgi:hypothetical protein